MDREGAVGRIRLSLGRVSMLVALLTLAALPVFSQAGQKTYTRLEIQDFMKNDRHVEAFRRGVEVMKQRKPDDPTSWIYQANIHEFQNLSVPGNACSHANQNAGVACGSASSVCPNQPICGTYDGPEVVPVVPVPTSWSSCPHSTWFFLPWHRMYLYNLEGILRKAACDSAPSAEEAQWCWDNFALPFWDYELKDNRDLPEIFRSPTLKGKPNSLYVEQRAPGMNQGTTPLTPGDVSTTKAMERIPYFLKTVPMLGSLSFGSLFTTAPTQHGGTGQLEQRPHNVVHDAVGGDCGYMAALQCAARDPIFYLHHANIDRLWQVWLNQGGGRTDPIDQAVWTGWKFTFFDPQGQPVEMTACDILNTLKQLDYQYENVEPKVTMACVQGQPKVTEAALAEPQVQSLLANEQDVVLGRKPVTVRVATAQEAGPKVLSAAKAAPDDKPLLLILDQVELVNIGAYYRVFLNLPEGQEPDQSSIYYIGTLALFGKHHHGEGSSQAYEIDDAVKALEQRGQWNGEIRLTFVRGNEPAQGGAGEQTYIRIGRIEVSALR